VGAARRDTRDALAHYLAENGFNTKAYTEPTYEIEAFGCRYVFKNTPNRKWAIPLHDLHHAATGYGTDLVGEAEVGVWELMGGCQTPIVYALNIVAVLFGALLAPLRILRAVRDGRGARALYRLDHEYEELLVLPLGELCRRLGIPSGGMAWAPRRLHDDGERKRADALPGAPPVPGWAAVLAMVYGLSTFGKWPSSSRTAAPWRGWRSIRARSVGSAWSARCSPHSWPRARRPRGVVRSAGEPSSGSRPWASRVPTSWQRRAPGPRQGWP
jgi:hypothetical protein